MYFVLIDTAGIQPYIFGSNRLRENVGASYLVDQVTGDWPLAVVKDVAERHNIADAKHGRFIITSKARIEQGTLDAEVIYAGGGNVAILFKDESVYERFRRALTERVLIHAPGLQLLIHQQAFDWPTDILLETVVDGIRELGRQKQEATPPEPLLALPVTRTCRSTGLPATGITPTIGDDPGYVAAPSILAKHEVVRKANKRLQEELCLPSELAYPLPLDSLGRTYGEASYIAVVHADGDGMGLLIRERLQAFNQPEQNRDYILEMRAFSEQIKQASQAALLDMVQPLTQVGQDLVAPYVRLVKEEQDLQLRYHDGQRKLNKLDYVRSEDGGHQIPIRPLVFGGDDLTFVCDGRLAWGLTTRYLNAFEHHTKSVMGTRLTACAGIAIVKAHYPFARAYQLAEELTRSAKDYRHSLQQEVSCLDWHFTRGGLYGTLKEMRNREYRVSSGSLTLRPLTRDANPSHRGRSWLAVEALTREFQDTPTTPRDTPIWAGLRRNKMKRLLDTLRAGSAATRQLLLAMEMTLPTVDALPDQSNLQRGGWSADHCYYYDALELADVYIPLT